MAGFVIWVLLQRKKTNFIEEIGKNVKKIIIV